MDSENLRPLPGAVQARIVRKVALRLIPFLAVAYLLNYLDRTNIAFANLTMSKDLGLSETAYGLASGLFFVGYVFFEVPSNLALHRFGARRWIARIMVTWGLVAIGIAFVNSPTTLYIGRILLGVAEAGFFPGVMLYLTWWFPRTVRVRLIGLFMIALPVSSALGAPLSGAIIEYLHGFFGLAGWRVMFLIEGVPTVALGIAAWFYLTDYPRQAQWLAPGEREWLHATMAAEQRDTAESGHTSVRQSLWDARVWVLGFVYFGLGYGLFALSFFLPTIVAGFAESFHTEFSTFQSALIVAIPFAIGAIALVIWSRHSDRTGERIWHVALPTLLAAITVPVAMYMRSPAGAMAIISLTAIGIYAAFPVFWYLPSTFLTGPAAASGIAVVNTMGAAAGFAAPYLTGWLLDLTGTSKAGLWVVGVVMFASAIVLLAFGRRFHAQPTAEARPTEASPTPRTVP
ncbi:MFS transporter [Streptomyces antimycoticus]|uniref:MFS transporter n=1 Tax=Streptomyces antimycoticus TaxID=68175 RepID=A0A4D4K3C4_9ACTN|nr:MFS transporter [Streptomyces antimycoticus]GDY40413.1 MFS transporter [Streptomyces antimycoticus]